MNRIFISYKRVDKDRVFEIRKLIESRIGEECWIDLKGIESDAQFKNVIIKAINNCEVVLFMYSKAHTAIRDFERDWTVRELNFALAKNKRIVFVNIDGTPLTDEFNFDFGIKQQVDARSSEALNRLINDLHKWLNIPKGPANHFNPTPPDNPQELFNKGQSCYISKDHENAARYYREAAERGNASAQNNLGWLCQNGYGVAQNYSEALKWYRKAAERGNASAQNNLGWLYQNGHGVEQNNSEALKWYSKAAEQGNADAQYNIGELYYYGCGVEKNYSEALKWYSKAAAQGDAYAQYKLGVMCKNKKGVKRNYSEVKKRLIFASKKGYKSAKELLRKPPLKSPDNPTSVPPARPMATPIYPPLQHKDNIFKRYVSKHLILLCLLLIAGGIGLTLYYVSQEDPEELFYKGNACFESQDYTNAIRYYCEAAEQGNADAQNSLGYMYHYGYGVERDYSEALKWYSNAAEQGYAAAQCNIGDLYYFGQGVDQDYTEAVKWYQEAAKQGNASAQEQLGEMHYYGHGVAQNYSEALKWYSKAAEQGDAAAKYNIGDLYYLGQGVARDYTEAVKWYQEAAEQGNVDAQFSLGYCYYNGTGVEQDSVQAQMWLELAAEQGDEGAKIMLSEYFFSTN